MKRYTIYNKSIILIILLIIIFIVSLGFSYNIYISNKESDFQNKARYLVSDFVYKISKGQYEDNIYPYAVFNLSGKVLHSYNCSEYEEGKIYNINEALEFDKSYYLKNSKELKYSFALQNNEEVNGFVVFYIPRSDIDGANIVSSALYVLMPIIICFISIVLILIYAVLYIKKHILVPISEINNCSKAMINGDYNVCVVKSQKLKENEVEELTYNFELLRDELKNNLIKENKLKKNQKELISCISHDLKTPISTIKAYAEGLLDNIANTQDKRIKYQKIILSKCEVITKMINDLLDQSNAELGQLKINKRKVDINEYFNSLMKEIKVLVNHNKMSFNYINELTNITAYIDEDRITQVIYNIVENSIKYNDKNNGNITIKVLDKYDYVHMSIKDNGKGISSNDINYIFDKFYRAEKSRSMKIPGSGLGLSICKYIIEKHDGKIYCKSNIGEFTEIHFEFKITK